MYDIAVVKFISENGEEIGRDYEYRIPDYMKDEVKPDMLGIVCWKGGHRTNPGAVRIKSIKSVLDGEYSGDYAYLIGAIDTTRYEALIHTERKRKRLLDLIKAEQRKLIDNIDFDKLSALSPDAAELIAELKSLS